MLIVISGLPGVGKSAVAAAVAGALDGMHLSVDPIEDALLGAGVPQSWETGVAAYEAARAVAELNLALGRVVVVDAVNDSEPARDTWRVAASRAGSRLVFFRLALSDLSEHRRRLEGRVRRFTQIPEPTWEDVRRRASAYQPWPTDCLRVGADGSVAEVARVIVDQLPG